jgi:plastocyanin
MFQLDSRLLGPGDCFVQRFTTAGTVHYRLDRAPATDFSLAGEKPFMLTVAEHVGRSEHDSVQHNVAVQVQRSRLQVDTPQLEIGVGDTVRWHTQDSALRFAVSGASEGFAFDSRTLTAECAYTHAFMEAGTYRWRDANGSPIGGEVSVTNPVLSEDAQRKRWAEQLGKATHITIEGERADPPSVEVMTGQTVAWIVVKAPEITITDARFLHQE